MIAAPASFFFSTQSLWGLCILLISIDLVLHVLLFLELYYSNLTFYRRCVNVESAIDSAFRTVATSTRTAQRHVANNVPRHRHSEKYYGCLKITCD